MLQDAYFLAKSGADTAENEQHFAEILPVDRGVRGTERRAAFPASADLAADCPRTGLIDIHES